MCVRRHISGYLLGILFELKSYPRDKCNSRCMHARHQSYFSCRISSKRHIRDGVEGPCTCLWSGGTFSEVCRSVAELSTKHTFQLQRGKGLPAQLIPYMRLCFCTDESKFADIDLKEAGELSDADAPILKQLVSYLQRRLARYALPLSQSAVACPSHCSRLHSTAAATLISS